MNIKDFHSKFKEELNIRYEWAASNRDKLKDPYWEGKCDGIDCLEQLFDRLWKEYILKDKQNFSGWPDVEIIKEKDKNDYNLLQSYKRMLES